MKVLIISPNFPPVRDGTADWIFHLFCYLKKGNIKLELITTNNNEIRNFIEIHRLSGIFPVINWNLCGLIKLIKIIKYKDPDILHIEYPGGFGVVIRYKYRLLMSIFPLILKLCNYKGKMFLRLHEFNEVKITTRILAIILILGVDRIAIASKVDYGSIIKLLPFAKYKVEIIPSGSNIPYINIEPSEIVTTKALLQVHSKQAIVGYFGSLRQGKGVETLLKACKILVKKGIDFKLLMLSELKPYRTSYRKKISKIIGQLKLENYIHFTGFLDPKNTSKYLQCMDLIVLPFDKGISFRRGSLIAAIIHELPIVVTEVKSSDLGFSNDDEMIFVRPRDSFALANAIEKLINSKELRYELAKAVSRISDTFSWENIVTKILKSYQDSLGSKTERVE